MKIYTTAQLEEMLILASCIKSEGSALLSALKTESSEDIARYLKTFCELVECHCANLRKWSEVL